MSSAVMVVPDGDGYRIPGLDGAESWSIVPPTRWADGWCVSGTESGLVTLPDSDQLRLFAAAEDAVACAVTLAMRGSW